MAVEWHRDICPVYILLPCSRSCPVPLCGRQVTFELGSAENLGEKLFHSGAASHH